MKLQKEFVVVGVVRNQPHPSYLPSLPHQPAGRSGCWRRERRSCGISQGRCSIDQAIREKAEAEVLYSGCYVSYLGRESVSWGGFAIIDWD